MDILINMKWTFQPYLTSKLLPVIFVKILTGQQCEISRPYQSVMNQVFIVFETDLILLFYCTPVKNTYASNM